MWLPEFMKHRMALYLRSRTNAAVKLREQGMFSDSHRLLERTVRKCIRWLGCWNADTLNAMTQLSRTCRNTGDFGKCMALHQQVLSGQRPGNVTREIVDFTIVLVDGLILAGQAKGAFSVLIHAADEVDATTLTTAALEVSEGPTTCGLAVFHSPARYMSLLKADATAWLKAFTDSSGKSAITLSDRLLLNGNTEDASILLKHVVDTYKYGCRWAQVALEYSGGPAVCALATLMNPTLSSSDESAARNWLKSIIEEYMRKHPVVKDNGMLARLR